MKYTSKFALTLAALLVAGSVSAETSTEQVCTKAEFAYLFDYSGSMMLTPNQDKQAQKEKKEKGEQTDSQAQTSDQEKKGLMTPEEFDDTRRMTSVKMFMEEINSRLPKDEEIKAGIYSVAPYSEILPYGTYKAEDFKKDGIDEVYDRMEVMGRRSPLGIGLEKHGQTMAAAGQGGVVLLITDGVVNRGRAVVSMDEPERQADNSKDDGSTSQPGLDAFYAAAPSACIHVISLADTAEGKAMVDKIVAKKGCSTKVDLRDLMTDNQKLDKFISSTLFTCQKVMSLRGINFAFNKYNIDSKSEKILQEALQYIQSDSVKDKPFKIVGWTDYIGSDKYNQTLSLNRAKSVRTWLVNHGVDSSRLSVQGAGKSYKYTNKTAEGRYMNRRMDFVFDD